MTTQFETLGNAEGTLGSGVAITAGTNYYLCFLHNFTGTVPKPAGYNATSLSSALVDTTTSPSTSGRRRRSRRPSRRPAENGIANHYWIYGR